MKRNNIMYRVLIISDKPDEPVVRERIRVLLDEEQ